MNKIKDSYAICPPRQKPSFKVDEETTKKIAQNYRVMPSFGEAMYEHIILKHYSLLTNEHMKCRWQQYNEHIQERVKTPVIFPHVRDETFYNGSVRYLPAQSVFRRQDHRKKLKPGPGVDVRGQMPIPQELLMKRGAKNMEDPHIAVHKCKAVTNLKNTTVKTEKRDTKNKNELQQSHLM